MLKQHKRRLEPAFLLTLNNSIESGKTLLMKLHKNSPLRNSFANSSYVKFSEANLVGFDGLYMLKSHLLISLFIL